MPEVFIAIGILALIAAIFLLRGKGETSQPKQQVVHKPAANEQPADLAKPSASPKTQAAPFPAPQVPFPVPAANKQPADLARPSVSTPTQVSSPVSQVPFPVSAANKQTTDLAKSSAPTLIPFSDAQTPFPGEQTPFLGLQTPFPGEQTPFLGLQTPFPGEQTPFLGLQTPFPGEQTPFLGLQTPFPGEQTPFLGLQTPFPGEQTPFPDVPDAQATFLMPTANVAEPPATTETLTQVPFPVQNTVVAQTPVREIQPTHTHVQQAEPDQTPVPVARRGQLSAQPNDDLPEAQTQSSIPSGTVPSSPLNPVLRLLPNPPSIDQQLGELIADTWALQQQAAELGRRLNYLSNSIQHSRASTPHKPDASSRGDN